MRKPLEAVFLSLLLVVESIAWLAIILPVRIIVTPAYLMIGRRVMRSTLASGILMLVSGWCTLVLAAHWLEASWLNASTAEERIVCAFGVWLSSYSMLRIGMNRYDLFPEEVPPAAERFREPA